MARNGSGTYTLPPSNPVVSGTVIESDWANDTMSDLAAALSQSIAYDGQTTPIANLPMGGFHHTNVSSPSSRNQYATLGMVQDGLHQRVQITGGVDNLVGTLIGGSTAYVAGSLVSFFAPATNTGAMTLNYNGIGARSLTDQNGLSLSAGEIQTGEFVFAIYTGTEFRLLSSVDAAVAADLYNLSISGQVRPPSDVYPALTIATATTVNVPAGSAWIVPPGNDTDDAVLVTWISQTITMQFLTSSFTTFVMVDETGVIQQIPGRAIGVNFRHMAVLGVVEHITGVVNNVITRPSIFGDDGYRGRDQASLLANTIVNGGLVTPNSVSTLNLDVAQGTIFIPGGSANTVDSPNTFNVPPQANIQFRTLAGQNTTSALTSSVPVGSYDANGAGVVAALPNPGDATIHRLFYIYGQYVLAYGQQIYTSVENALSMIAWDRTKFKKSLYLADATLMAEIVAIRSATNLNIITQGAVVCPGGLNFSIGSPGGIAEAPIDGFPYGRRNAAWFQVLGSVSPVATVDATISGAAPMLKEIVTPYAAGTSGRTVYAAANRWYAEETVNPDDKTYFRSYNPGSGALRFTTTYDLATGEWSFPGLVTTPTANIATANVTTETVSNLTVTGSAVVPNLNGGQLAGLRNKIINGGCLISQRGPVALNPGVGTFGGADRFNVSTFGFASASGTITQAGSSGGPNSSTGYTQSIQNLTTTGSGIALFLQRIEFTDTLGMGGKPVTLSCKVQHDFGVTMPVTLSVNKANAQDDFSGTTLIGQSVGLTVPTGVPTALSFTVVLGAADANNGIQVNVSIDGIGAVFGKNINIGDWQFEIGSVVTPFEHRPFALELALCQRYYEIGGVFCVPGSVVAGFNAGTTVKFAARKRVIPTITQVSSSASNMSNTPNKANTDDPGESFLSFRVATVTGAAQYTESWTASAEL